MKRSLTVLLAEAGRPLGEFLAARLGSSDAIARGSVHVGGRRTTDPARPVRAGEKVVVYLDQAAPVPFRIVHRSAELIVVDKPVGIPVQATRQAARNSLEAQLGARAAHRLDLDASGLVAFGALDPRTMRRRYLALASGEVRADQGRWASPVAGKPAATRYRVEKRLCGATLVELELETGRTHQIRVHAAAAHHPLVGDRRHGGPPAERLMLHAHALAIGGQSFQSPPPEDFLRVLAAWAKDADAARSPRKPGRG